MATTLSNHLGFNAEHFRRSLKYEYWKSRVSNLFLSLFEKKRAKLTKKLIYQIDDAAITLMAFYEKVDSISAQDAKVLYPDIKKTREVITKQKNKFAKLNYDDSQELETKFQKLVHLVNRLEARVHRQMHQHTEPKSAPTYIKDRMRANTHRMMDDATL